MRTRTVRDTRIALPSDDPTELPTLDTLPAPGERVHDHVLTGGFWTRATITDVVISNCWLTGADLSATTFTKLTLDRCVLTGCTLMGTTWQTVTLRDVILEDCRLDYATITDLSTAGPAAFQRCSFTETTIADSTLTRTVFDQCRLDQLELHRSNLRGADLRGNHLNGLTNPTSLRGTHLDQHQLPGLIDALVRELAIIVTHEQ